MSIYFCQYLYISYSHGCLVELTLNGSRSIEYAGGNFHDRRCLKKSVHRWLSTKKSLSIPTFEPLSCLSPYLFILYVKSFENSYDAREIWGALRTFLHMNRKIVLDHGKFQPGGWAVDETVTDAGLITHAEPLFSSNWALSGWDMTPESRHFALSSAGSRCLHIIFWGVWQPLWRILISTPGSLVVSSIRRMCQHTQFCIIREAFNSAFSSRQSFWTSGYETYLYWWRRAVQSICVASIKRCYFLLLPRHAVPLMASSCDLCLFYVRTTACWSYYFHYAGPLSRRWQGMSKGLSPLWSRNGPFYDGFYVFLFLNTLCICFLSHSRSLSSP
jgi:hypothetical protein